MARVSGELRRIIEAQLAARGIVVWYDAERAYEQWVGSLALPDAPVLRYESSFFALKAALEPFLEWVAADGRPDPGGHVPRRVLVYVPLSQDQSHYALVEAETAGAVLQPGAQPRQDTRLKTIAERVFREVDPQQAAEVGLQVERGAYGLAELDRMAEQQGSAADAGLRLIFNTASPTEVALAFAQDGRYDAAITAKQAMPPLAALLEAEFGVALKPSTAPAAARAEVRRRLLAGDLLAGIPSAQRPRQLTALAPGDEAQLGRCRQVCEHWRNRVDAREEYSHAARQVEAEVRFPSLSIPVAALAASETFPSAEEVLLAEAEGRITAGELRPALELAEARLRYFWATAEPAFGLQWAFLASACRAGLLASTVRAALKPAQRDADGLLAAYAAGPEPWCLLDTYYRQMESYDAQRRERAAGDRDGLDRAVRQTRQTYTEAVAALAEAWTDALAASAFRPQGAPRQDRVYADYVAPALREGRRTAYFLVDALRFEMGRELALSLERDFEAALFPTLAVAPTVTEVGMAALLPGAEQGMALASKAEKLAVRLDGAVLRDRAGRLAYMQSRVEAKLLALKMSEISRAKRKIEEASPGLLLVTSQEIDKQGEMGDDDDGAREYMNNMLARLSQVISRLAQLGFEHFVIAADHGHLYGEAGEAGLKMDPPGGQTLALRRRVWVGRGGDSGAGFLRLSSRDLGLDGEWEAAFPRGLGLFKTRGGSATYFHGGLSLQEMLIPVLVLKARARQPAARGARVELALARGKVTTRFFSLTLTYRAEGLFGADAVEVRLAVTAGRREAGAPVMAAYGFNEASREVRLLRDQPNPVTVGVAEEGITRLTVTVQDAATQVELGRLENIAVEIAI